MKSSRGKQIFFLSVATQVGYTMRGWNDGEKSDSSEIYIRTRNGVLELTNILWFEKKIGRVM